MMYYKSCPRCEGDRSLEHDFDGYYLLCLQCGGVQYPNIQSKPRISRAYSQAVPERAISPVPSEAIVERLRKSVTLVGA
jgi:hypothetical protein